MDRTRSAHYYDKLDEERTARQYIEAHQAMKEALELLLHEPMSERAVDKAKKALLLANGGSTDE